MIISVQKDDYCLACAEEGMDIVGQHPLFTGNVCSECKVRSLKYDLIGTKNTKRGINTISIIVMLLNAGFF